MPEVRVAVMVLVTEEPWVTEISPELESAKSKAGAIKLQMVVLAMLLKLDKKDRLVAAACVLRKA